MKLILGVGLFLIACGLSAAALLRVISSDRIGFKPSLVWTVALAVAWAAWYILR